MGYIEERLRQLGKISDMAPEQSVRLSSYLEKVFQETPTVQNRRKVVPISTWVIGGLVGAAVIALGIRQSVLPNQAVTTTPTSQPADIAIPFDPISGVHMVNENTGWGIILGGTAILRTTDGGKNWTNVTPPQSTDPRGIMAVSINANVAYIATIEGDGTNTKTVLYGTLDGGTSWKPLTALDHRNGFPIFISFTDQAHGWMITGLRKNGDETYPGNLYRTVDGGTTWTVVRAMDVKGHSIMDWVAFVDTSHGIAAGVTQISHPPAGAPAPWGHPDFNTLTFENSSDGGASWTDTHIPIPPSEDKKFVDMKIPMFAGAFGYTRINDRLYVSTDYGHSWRVQGGRVEHLVEFTGSQYGWEYGATAGLLMTTDGGSHWAKTKGQVPGIVTSIDFINHTTGWVTTTEGLFRTSDSGTTWIKVSSQQFTDSGQ